MLREDHILARYKNHSRRMKQAVNNTEFPETWPALHYMPLDDEGRLWISAIMDDSDQYRWWVIDSNGKPLGTFKPSNGPEDICTGILKKEELKLLKMGISMPLKPMRKQEFSS